MSTYKHYTPILKWKSAEKKALVSLGLEHKKNITPLIQFVMPKPVSSKTKTVPEDPEKKLAYVIKEFEANIPNLAKEVEEYWGKDKIFIDFSLLYTTSLKVKAIEYIMKHGDKLNSKFIPVFNFSDEEELKKIAIEQSERNNSGICLRLVYSDVADIEKLNKELNIFLKKYKLNKSNIDILIDLKNIEAGSGKYEKYLGLSQKIIDLNKWRTFIFACGSFPKDLSDCKFGEETYVTRLEWKKWTELISNKKIIRKPYFSDYTIQHPIYNESSQFYYPSTSIKYTLDDKWLIMKGKRHKYIYYLGHAKVLYDNKDLFFGDDFSYGDKYIAEKAEHYPKYEKSPKIGGTGNTVTWLGACINHHLACTANQISKLS